MQSAVLVGDRVGVCDGDADGAALGDVLGDVLGACVGCDVMHRPPRQTSLAQSDGCRHALSSPQGGHSGPPQSTDVSRSFFIPSSQDARDGDLVGDALGLELGFALGASVGDALGSAVVGARVGASVLSQQLRYVLPSRAGQHSPP